MKIICLIKPSPPLIYFVNRIHEEHGVSLVVVEKGQTGVGEIIRKMRKHGLCRSLQIALSQLGGRRRRQNDFNRFFGRKWKSLDPDIPRFEVENINSELVHRRLDEEHADLLLDHGTSIVKDHILETAELAFNLHWGLSPYYRGTLCTNWALLNWDPNNIGVTIHKLSRAIDGGDIVVQRRAEITADDTCHSINMKLTKLGTVAVIDVVTRLKRGEQLEFHFQDLRQGYLSYLRQWSWILELQIARIEKRGYIGRMLKHPARRERLPIVELNGGND